MSILKGKIHEIMAQPILASLATITEDGNPWVRFVVIKADEALAIFFATFTGSRKTRQIEINPEVHLAVSTGDLENPGPYLQVQGHAEILTDPEIKRRVWYDHLGNIFTGYEDPNYCVGKVTPYRIEYTIPKPGQPPEIWQR